MKIGKEIPKTHHDPNDPLERFKTSGIWLATMREKARQQGYYYVEGLGSWSEGDRETYLQYVTRLNILYIHGLSSSGSSGTAEKLRRYLPDDVIFSPDLPIDPHKALAMLREIVKREDIDIVIGTSMGGMFAQKLRGYHKILINPSFHVSRSMRKRLGVNRFFSQRADGATEYIITEDLCDRYAALECGQFENITDEERALTHGMFGTDDNVVNCEQEFLNHYDKYHCHTFAGGHRLDGRNIQRDVWEVVDMIRKKLETEYYEKISN